MVFWLILTNSVFCASLAPPLQPFMRQLYPPGLGPVSDIVGSGPSPVLARVAEWVQVAPRWEGLTQQARLGGAVRGRGVVQHPLQGGGAGQCGTSWGVVLRFGCPAACSQRAYSIIAFVCCFQLIACVPQMEAGPAMVKRLAGGVHLTTAPPPALQ